MLRDDLAAVGIGPSIRHGQKSGRIVLQLEVLVCKLFAVDALAAGSVMVGKVAALKHELGDDTVKSGSFVPEALFFRAQEPEVARRFGHNVVKKFEDDTTGRLAANGDIKKHV